MNKKIANRTKAKWVSAVLIGSMAMPVFATDYESHWAKNAITRWSDYSIVKGYGSGNFKPDDAVTRAQLGAFMTRVFKYKAVEPIKEYQDISKNAWYGNTIGAISNKAILYLEGEQFKPNQNITREEAAYAMAKAYRIIPSEKSAGFKDQAAISKWAVGAINALVEKDYMKGNPDGTFNPKSELTRAEFIAMLDKINHNYIDKNGVYTTLEKGNTMINVPNVVLKDVVIDGDLYLAEGIGSGGIILDNVTVKGRVVVEGGNVQLSGDFKCVEVYSTTPVQLLKGSVSKLQVENKNAAISISQGVLVNGIETTKEQTVVGGGEGGAGPVLPNKAVTLKNAGLKINGKYYPLPKQGNCIVLDIPNLLSSFGGGSVVEGVMIEADAPSAYVEGDGGTLVASNYYTLRELEDNLGLVREAARQEGINSNSVIDAVLPQGSVSIDVMVDKLNTVKSLANTWGVKIKDEYEYTRTLGADGYEASSVEIRLVLP